MEIVQQPSIGEIESAHHRLRDVVVKTPLVPLHSFGEPSSIHLKLETLQPVTSFKIRGIYHAVASLEDSDRAKGVSTVSAGNTAQALAWAAKQFGVSARSIMPETAPSTKIEAVRTYGGEPVLVSIEEVFRFLKEHLWLNESYSFIHPWTNRNVLIGHGSMGIEIIEQCPRLETLFVPVGGGGLIGGVGSAIKALNPNIRLIAVEPENCPSFYESRKAGHPVSVECKTICDGVAVPYMTDEMFPLLCELVDDCVLVSERDVASAVRRLAQGNKVVAEPSGALAVAAALNTPDSDRGVCTAIVTGGSIDSEKLVSLLSSS